MQTNKDCFLVTIFVYFSAEQKKKPLPLKKLKTESCAQVSCHDVITLCGLEQYMISYDSNNDKGDKANKKGEQKKQYKVLLIDIRPWEEYPLLAKNQQGFLIAIAS